MAVAATEAAEATLKIFMSLKFDELELREGMERGGNGEVGGGGMEEIRKVIGEETKHGNTSIRTSRLKDTEIRKGYRIQAQYARIPEKCM